MVPEHDHNACRAADVASIMGIDVDAVEAVAGAAKGNFTMMDNLGVAINDTSLKPMPPPKASRPGQTMTTGKGRHCSNVS